MRKTLVTSLLTVCLVLVTAAPVYAATTPTRLEPPGDNSPWVAVVAALVLLAVAGGMLAIANAYRKNNQSNQNRH